jgi:hypothetical protein
MPAQITDLFLLEDLEEVGRTSELAESDLDALYLNRQKSRGPLSVNHLGDGPPGRGCARAWPRTHGSVRSQLMHANVRKSTRTRARASSS